jgi:hypothetical protein
MSQQPKRLRATAQPRTEIQRGSRPPFTEVVSMFAIYVQRTWLNTIGDVAGLVTIWEQTGDCVSVLAASAAINYPFVEAKLARKQSTEKGDAFLPAQIPIAVVSGIFNLTSGEVSKYGFHPPENK